MTADEAATDPERAFRLLSDETRVAILRALWDASDETLSFTALRERVGNPNSGQFNYHLGKLRDHFVTKRGDGYRLTQAGREVVRAVLAGSITDQPNLEAAPIDGECPECGASLVVRYDEYGIVECSECAKTVMWNEFPPAGLADRTPEQVAVAFDRWTRNRFYLAMDGVCPNCAGEMSTEIRDDADLATDHRCRNCKYEARVPLFGHVIRHPAVVSFFDDRGVDVTDMPYWELRTLARDFEETVLSESPWSASVTIEVDGERLRLILDDRVAVSDVERSDS